MIVFPDVAYREWRAIADIKAAEAESRKRIKRGTLIENQLEKLKINHEASLLFQEEQDAEGTPDLEMMTLEEFHNNPTVAPVDLIDGVLKDNGSCGVLGAAGSGKSSSALQMIHSLLTGDDWLGQRVTQLHGGAGVISYDMHLSRILDWMNGMPNLDKSRIRGVNAYGRGNPLAVPDKRAAIIEDWTKNKVEVVMIDSFSASFSGDNQNDGAQVQRWYRNMVDFAMTDIGARAVIFIVHSTNSKPDSGRGSTVHQDAVDSQYAVIKDNVSGVRTVLMTKYREDRQGVPEMTPRVLTAPDPVTHLVSLDTGAMSLAQYPIPPSIGGMFDAITDTYEDPDTTEDPESELEDFNL